MKGFNSIQKPLASYLIDLSLVTDVLKYFAGVTFWALNILSTFNEMLAETSKPEVR